MTDHDPNDYIARNHYPYEVRRYRHDRKIFISTSDLNLDEALKLVSIELTNSNPEWDHIFVSQNHGGLEHYVFSYVRADYTDELDACMDCRMPLDRCLCSGGAQ